MGNAFISAGSEIKTKYVFCFVSLCVLTLRFARSQMFNVADIYLTFEATFLEAFLFISRVFVTKACP